MMHATTSRRPSSLLALIVGVLVLVLAGAPAAHACSCMGYTFDESAERADLIADITIVHEVEEDSGHVTYLAAIDTVWKGEQSRAIMFATHEETTACGLGRLTDGSSLLVWASGGEGRYSTTWCSLPTDGGPDDRERLTERFGEPADLSDQPIPEQRSAFPPVWLLIALPVAAVIGSTLVSVIALVVVLVLMRRRARRG